MPFYKASKGGAIGFNYRTWLLSASISPADYDSLNSVLSDEIAIRKLMTIHSAVDYLSSFTVDDESIITILRNDICAKWINLRDYALDTLYSNPYIKILMDKVDKYGYGEWALIDGTWQPKGNVPVMTSNTEPYGTASAYQVFDGSLSTTAQATDFSYKFVTPTCVKKFVCKNTSNANISGCTLQGSNDGSTWTNISTPTSNADYYLYYRLHFASSKTVASIQFYGRELRVSVPTMTSNTAPWGEAIESGEWNATYSAWKAFDNASDLTWWDDANGAPMPRYIGYDFKRDVVITNVILNEHPNENGGIFYIQYYDENSNSWITCTESYSTTDSKNVYISIHNKHKSKKWRLYLTEKYSNSFAALLLQFYGLDYSEYDWDEDNPRHYLYDHGVELESLTLSDFASKDQQAIRLYNQNASALNTLNTTNYNLLRAVEGLYGSGTNRVVCGSGYRDIITVDLPRNLYLDISSINASSATGVSQTATGIFTAEEIWIE